MEQHINNSKYTTWYFQLINKALSQNRSKGETYYESHHIHPRSIFPELSRSKGNLVLLTAREHFIAHLLLTKMFDLPTYKRSMANALWRMTFSSRNHERYLTSRQVQTAKELWVKNGQRPEPKFGDSNPSKRADVREKIAASKRGKARDQATKNKISETKKARQHVPHNKGIARTAEQKASHSAKMKGRCKVYRGEKIVFISKDDLFAYVAGGWIRGNRPRP